jgi:hypothetical protein
MKTTIKNPGLEDWQRYNSKNAGSSTPHDFEKNISADDLNYLAAAGFAKGNLQASDVNDIYRRINRRTFSSVNLNAVFIGGLVVITFVGAFFFLSDPGNSPATPTNALQQNAASIAAKKTFSTDNTSAEIVVSPTGEKPLKSGAWNKEHFAIEKIEQPYAESAPSVKEETEDMSIKPITSLAVENTSEINIEQLPNAPVIYHKGLKVTNYHLYYFKNNQPFQLVNGGLNAAYETVPDYKAMKKENKDAYKTTADAVLREALSLFADAHYSACLENFDLLLKLNKTDVNANFYSAMSYYSLQKFPRAIEYFDNVLASSNNIFHQEAEFYKALALIANSQKAEAVNLLQKIAGFKGFYAERAREILNKG